MKVNHSANGFELLLLLLWFFHKHLEECREELCRSLPGIPWGKHNRSRV
jgi:hypothetical protein